MNLLFSIISGILTGLSFNYPHLNFLVWFSLVPFFLILSKAESLLLRIGCGFIFGLSFHLTAIFWLGNISRLTWVGLIGYLALAVAVIYLSLYTAFFALLSRFFLNRRFAIFSLACFWVVVEFLKENIWCGMGWVNLGYTQWQNLHMVQIVDILGVKFISFLIVSINLLLYKTIAEKKFHIQSTITLISILLICSGYSFYRINTLNSREVIKAAVIQPNTAESEKYSLSSGIKVVDRMEVKASKTDKRALVIFPEAAWPFSLEEDALFELKDFAESINRDILIGSNTESQGKFYNSAILLNRDGHLKKIYRKIKIVPFGEYIPMRKYLTFITVINQLGDMSPGKKFTQFDFKGKKFSTLICFEDIFPRLAAKFARQSDFLVNITNDEWFGGEPEASQHLAIMIFRAIENRISIIRAANTGISAWVDFKGNVSKFNTQGKETFVQGVWNFDVNINSKRSFYAQYPELLVIFCLLGLLVAFLPKNKKIM